MPPFLAHQSWSSFDDKTLFPDSEAILTLCVSDPETLKECIPDLFDVLCSDKTEYYAENHIFL